jgi:molybdopterin molybdotransferase
MISVAQAQARLLALAEPLPPTTLRLSESYGRYLAQDIIARRSQPAADLSAMDGYAIRFSDMPGPWKTIGESAAGAPYSGAVGAGETVRIFTGAHLPKGADTILIQEDAQGDGAVIMLIADGPDHVGKHIRKSGTDFISGDHLLSSGTLLSSGAVAVAAMAGYGEIAVGGRPKISIITTGDELVSPGTPCSDAQIPSSNSFMLMAALSNMGADIIDHGIVGDSLADLKQAFADCSGSDIIVTTGGASVGDHDFVQDALLQSGASIDFWRVAMKPGKPVMLAKLGKTIVVGLPGNPSSAFVTAFLFLLPLVRHLSGCTDPLPVPDTTILKTAIPATGERAEYLRAAYSDGTISVFSHQDSGLVNILAKANALIIRSPFSDGAAIGQTVPIYRLAY